MATPSLALPLQIVIGHYCWTPPNIISAMTSSMDSTITYDMVKALVANPPSLEDRPNFFNLRDLQNHFACALKWIACPQSQVNGWVGFVLTPVMYSLIDPKPFDIKISEPTHYHQSPQIPTNIRRGWHHRCPIHV
jgi:hypothetical protein